MNEIKKNKKIEGWEWFNLIQCLGMGISLLIILYKLTQISLKLVHLNDYTPASLIILSMTLILLFLFNLIFKQVEKDDDRKWIKENCL